MSWQTIVKDNNLEVSVIPASKLEGAVRLDSDYYQVKYLKNKEFLGSKECKTILELTDYVKKGIFDISPEKYLEEGVPLIRVKDIKGGFLDYSTMVFISEEDHTKEKKTELNVGDIVFSKVGTVGEVAIIDKKSNFSQNVLGIKIKKKDINPKYLLCFLLSPAGNYQIKRAEMISVQPKLELTDIRELLVPIASSQFQDAVASVVDASKEKKNKSSETYKGAEQMLLKEINLEGYKGTDEAISVRNFSEALADNRFDAEYWQPKYDEITKRVSKVLQEKLGDIVSAKKGVEVGSEAYAEEGKDFIRVSDFTIYGIEDVEKKISEELYDGLKENYKPKKGEVLFTKDGTIGISFALNEDVDAIVSGAFLRLKPKVKINNNYLALVLNSFYCKAQIERMSGGAIIAHLKPESAMEIKVPMLSEKKQEELAGKVLEALRLRKEAKKLLEKAKRAVEIFVEKDENTALKSLEIL